MQVHALATARADGVCLQALETGLTFKNWGVMKVTDSTLSLIIIAPPHDPGALGAYGTTCQKLLQV